MTIQKVRLIFIIERLTLAAAFLFVCISGYAQKPDPPKPRQVFAGTGAYTEEPRSILTKAGAAVRAVRNLKYTAHYQGSGAMSTRSPVASGEVELSKLAVDDPRKAKLAASGTYFVSGDDERLPFHTTFDGATIRRLRPKTKTVITKTLSTANPRERALGYVTSFFGGGPYQLLLLEYLNDAPFDVQTKAAVADYEGRAVVEGVACHVIYVEYPSKQDGRTQRERWFLGIKDNLPRRSEIIVSDSEGRFGAFVLTIRDLRVDPPSRPHAFSFAIPRGYTAKPFEEPPLPQLLNVGDTAPEWKLTDAAGNTRSLSDLRGKIVVLDFWATWCGPCIRAMPSLQSVHDRYGTLGVEVFGVNVWEESNAAEFMKRNGFTYGLLLKGETVADAYHVPSLPTLYIIGPDGTIIHWAKGLEENLDALIENHLKLIDR